jgi:hypothetical protein
MANVTETQKKPPNPRVARQPKSRLVRVLIFGIGMVTCLTEIAGASSYRDPVVSSSVARVPAKKEVCLIWHFSSKNSSNRGPWEVRL